MNEPNYVALDFSDPTDLSQLYPQSRRDFLKRAGAGIFIFVALGDLAEAQEGGRGRGGGRGGGLPSDFNAYLTIAEDGRVTCFTGKIEMGQGPITSLPQEVADELDAPLDSVDIVMGDTGRCPWDMGTFGSMTTRVFGPALRAAAAEARGVLLELAAESLKVPKEQLTAKDGVIFDSQNKDHKVTFGQLAKGQKIERHLTVKPTVKTPAQLTLVGKPLLHRDGHDKVTGKAKYTADLREPGMLYAKLLRPPAHGAKLKSADTSAAKQIPGVQVVEDGDLVAVLHELPDVAEKALAAIKAEFDVPAPAADDKTIYDYLLKATPAAVPVNPMGNLEEGRKNAAKSFDKTYYTSYVAHAPMETHAGFAKIDGDKATVWASTQNPFTLQGEVARAVGFQQANVRVITPYVGGGFGGKTTNTQAVEAARLAKAVGKPVQVMYHRDEEFFYDAFRPAAVVKVSSGIDDAGKMTFWDYEVFYAGSRGTERFYTVPNYRNAVRGGGGMGGGPHPFATGAWRAPGNSTNTFAREAQMDIMASAAGIDPIEFRLKHADARMTRVLTALAKKFGWTPGVAPSKRGLGVACGTDADAYVAAIAEVSVDPKKGTVQVKRVVCVQEMGQVINPQGATIQMEGCIMMGLGYTLTEEIHFNGGKVNDTNFDTYELPKFSWMPKIETEILDAHESPPAGGGEPPVILMGAVVANAIFDATGARLYQLPMTPERVRAAMSA